jgi:hypothetical protein
MAQQGSSSELKSFEFDEVKFRELVIYIAQNSTDDPTFGSVKLNKVLYYSDFASYRLLGRPITGAKYQKLLEGPAPRELLSVRDGLIQCGDAQIETRPYFTGQQKRLVIATGREANKEIFDPSELELVDEVIDYFHGKTAREVSDFSHREPGWVLARDRETIPYETAWLSGDPIDAEIEQLGLRFVQEDV